MAILNLGENDPCPCGSGNSLRDCCLETNGDNIAIDDCVTTVPPCNPPHHHPKCYASALGTCSTQISREHYISHSLLSEMSKPGGFSIRGFSWQSDPSKSQQMSIKRLCSKRLCDTHNSALSPLDAVGKMVFVALREAYDYVNDLQPRKDDVIHVFNGHNIERWLLKMVIGAIVSKSMAIRYGREAEGYYGRLVPDNPLPLDWLHVLYGLGSFPHGDGLYFLVGSEHKYRRAGLDLSPKIANGILLGWIISVCGVQMVLSNSGQPSDPSDPLLKDPKYRPSRIEIRNTITGAKVIFLLRWRQKEDPGHVIVQYTPKVV